MAIINTTEKAVASDMTQIDFTGIIQQAWSAYDNTRNIVRITDISARVSTNHVYSVRFSDNNFIIAKLSYYGTFEHFVEDHSIIDTLSNNLPAPFENFLARSLAKGRQLFVYHHQSSLMDAWVVFYRPIEIKRKLPRRLNEDQIAKLASQVALFHKACHSIRNTLPPSSKTLETDIDHLLQILDTDEGRYEFRLHTDEIRRHAGLFLENTHKLGEPHWDKIPVFVDWNIGNFSVTSSLKLFSRWDYDWFRMGSRMLDFYFLSRVSSDVGDRTVFSYHATTLMEERFILFLKNYHNVYPLTENEIRFLGEAYRFFILNYVLKDGRHFFHQIFATKLQREALEIHLPSLDKTFDANVLLRALKL